MGSITSILFPGSEGQRDVYWVAFTALLECFESNSVYERLADSWPTSHYEPYLCVENEWQVLTNERHSLASNERAQARIGSNANSMAIFRYPFRYFYVCGI